MDWRGGRENQYDWGQTALIFNSMLVHGFSPDSVLLGTMVPMPKDKRQLVCISKEQNALATSHLQCPWFVC